MTKKKTIIVPSVGESITDVVVGQWLKVDGDKVIVDELVCELESDKASFEVTAEVGGILKIKAQEGDTFGCWRNIGLHRTKPNSF